MLIDYQSRMSEFLAQQSVGCFALIPGTNMLYFTGMDFHLGKRPIIGFFSQTGVAFVIPLLEVAKFEDASGVSATLFAWSDAQSYQGALRDAITHLGLDATTTVGVDGFTMRVFEWLALLEGGVKPANLSDVGRALMMFRAIKTPDEIALIQQAIHISEQALTQLMTWVKPGMTEKEIATRLMQEQIRLGAHEVAFEPIVLVGARSALPHGNPGDKKLAENDILLIDYGCKVNHYPSDITRTFLIGTVSPQIQHMHDTVYQANAAARAVARPGVTWGEVDQAARAVIEEAGLGQYFTHRTGHGLGLDGHELPQIAANENDVLREGMVFTIEPGVYIPGVGGIRIEDNMVVTDDSCVSMTTYPREYTA